MLTFRAVLIGILLGLGVAATTYFNDAVIRQTFLIGNLLPISVFGGAVFLLLVVNPLLRLVGPRSPLRAGEIAVVVAIGLAVCGWPGSNFFRVFATTLALPSHYLKIKANWQAAEVMAYVPGGSATVAMGQVQSWPAFTQKLMAAESGPGARLRDLLSPTAHALVAKAANGEALTSSEKTSLLRAVNEVLRRRDFTAAPPAGDVVRHNRAALTAAFPEELLPPPAGNGVLLAGGQADPVAVDLLIKGSSQPLGMTDLPWRVWWPTLLLWGGVALLMAGAAFCLALIVHPQWSQRELLPYPVARFMQEMVRPTANGWWPEQARSRLFWFGFGAIILLHTINGLHEWFPAVGAIQRQIDLRPLLQLFPTMSRVPGSNQVLGPTIFFSVAAFTFFLNTEVSLSLALMGPVWLLFGAALLANGVPVQGGGFDPKLGSLLLFGAHLGLGLMILYIGRRHYANVLRSAWGGRRHPETPLYSTRAAQVLFLCLAGAVLLLWRNGLDWPLAVLLVLAVTMMFLVIGRINAETGAIMIQPNWLPVGILTAVFGFEAVGPTAFIVLGLASVILTCDPRETWLPYLLNGLQMAGAETRQLPRQLFGWLGLMLVAGFIVALGVTFWNQYNRGINTSDAWATVNMPHATFNHVATAIAESAAYDELPKATAIHGWERFGQMNPKPGVVLWIGVGLTLVLACSLMRLWYAWWPLHPVIFLLWGTGGALVFSGSFFLGWLAKMLVTKLGGAQAYEQTKPLMVGIIAGELLAGLGWMLVGALYYFVTGLTPKSYVILPT